MDICCINVRIKELKISYCSQYSFFSIICLAGQVLSKFEFIVYSFPAVALKRNSTKLRPSEYPEKLLIRIKPKMFYDDLGILFSLSRRVRKRWGQFWVSLVFQNFGFFSLSFFLFYAWLLAIFDYIFIVQVLFGNALFVSKT